MKIIFVCGDPSGGALKSTQELARRVAETGDQVVLIRRTASAPRLSAYMHKRTYNLVVKLANRRLRRIALVAHQRIGRRSLPTRSSPYTELAAPFVEHAMLPVISRHRPDIVVVNSVYPLTWKRVHALLTERQIPVAHYVREATSYNHFQSVDFLPDLLMSNAEAHTQALRVLGREAITVPSVVDLDACRVESSRRVALFVNPLPGYGLERLLALAEARPDVPFVVQESWPSLEKKQLLDLRERLRHLPSVVWRHFQADRRTVYADARLLVIPYEVPCRPRVVLEAQANGIPVLASDVAGLQEAVGAGGKHVGLDEPLQRWLDALSQLWDDEAHYEEAVAAARLHASRSEVDPAAIVDRFRSALQDVVGQIASTR